MAKAPAVIIIRIMDNENGSVNIESSPSFQDMAQAINSGSSEITSAHGYALRMLREARKLSKETELGGGPMKIYLPGIG